MNNTLFLKILLVTGFIYGSFLISSCNKIAVYPRPIIPVSALAEPQETIIHTHKTTSILSLEAPLRCNIETKKQNLIKTISYNDNLFVLEKTDWTDPLPRYEVTGFSFKKMEAEKAVELLVKEIGIRVIAKDEPYLEMSAEGLKGELTDIIDMITSAAEVFYRYDKNHQVLEIKKRADFKLNIPHNDLVILAVLDALRGSGVRDLVVDWEDKALLFSADAETQRKVETLIKAFDEEPLMLVFDTSVYRFYPNEISKEVQWQEMLRVFGREKIKMSLSGVMGKMLITSSEINNLSLMEFMNNYGSATKLSEGLLVVPNKWKSRFDVGRCGRSDTGEADLSILAESFILPNRRIETNITLDTTAGEITRFNPKHRLGENYLIIGIPSKLLDSQAKDAETVILMTPRLIKIIKEEEQVVSAAKSDQKEEEKGLSNWLIDLMNK